MTNLRKNRSSCTLRGVSQSTTACTHLHSLSLSYIVLLTLGVSLGSPVKEVPPQGEFFFLHKKSPLLGWRSSQIEYLHPLVTTKVRIGILHVGCNGERNSLSKRGIGSQSFPKRLGKKRAPLEVLGLARCTLEPSSACMMP